MYHHIPKGLPKKTCASAAVCSGVTSDLMVILVQVSKCPLLFGTDWCSRLCFLVWWCGCVQTPTVSNARNLEVPFANQPFWSILVVQKRVSLWQVLNHLLLLARCTGARSEMLTAKLPALRNIAVENRKGGWSGSKDGCVTSVCPNMAPQISTSKSLVFLDQTKSQNHSCKCWEGTIQVLSYAATDPYPIWQAEGSRIAWVNSHQGTSNGGKRGQFYFNLSQTCAPSWRFTSRSIISTDVPKLLGGVDSMETCTPLLWVNIPHGGYHPNIIQTSLFFWLCLLI